MKKKVIVIMPGHNVAETIEKTYHDLDLNVVDEVLFGDDCSTDNSSEVAQKLGISVLRADTQVYYGGIQKMLYQEALKRGADVIVMVHPDWQYDPTKVAALIDPILKGEKDLMFGSRYKDGKPTAYMPAWRNFGNQFLTKIENFVMGTTVSELHSGMRAYSRRLLETIDFISNSNDFVFDSELIFKSNAAGFKMGEIVVDCRYLSDSSSASFRKVFIYALGTLFLCLRWFLWRRV